MTNRFRTGLSLPVTAAALLLLVGACTEPPSQDASAMGETVSEGSAVAHRSLTITAPREGETVLGPDVTVRLAEENMETGPAGDMTHDSGHLHIIVNADLPAIDAPIPAVEGVYIHMGMGQTEHTLTGLEPGEYRIIALIGNHTHMSVDPPVVDTVRFVVQ